MRTPSLMIAALGLGGAPVAAAAQTVDDPSQLKPYNVTIRRFDPTQGDTELGIP